MKLKNMTTRKCVMSFSMADLRKATAELSRCGVSYNVAVSSIGALRKHTESMGIFGSSGDADKFYPGVTAESIVPKDADFVSIPWRLISATIVGANTWKATDFSDTKVLKAATKLLNNKPVYKDHNTDLENWVGDVTNPTWEEAYVDSSGLSIPAGINGLINIDAATNPKIARGALRGVIFSNSVTVLFEYEPSHIFKNEDDFEQNIGTVIDGRMVARRVTKIDDFFETSLLWLGADPFAKKIDKKGELVNVDRTSVFKDEKEIVRTKYEKEKSFKIVCTNEENVLNLCRQKVVNFTKKIDNNIKLENMDVLAALKLKLGIPDATELTVEAVEALFKSPEEIALLNYAKDVKAKLAAASLSNIEALAFVSVDKVALYEQAAVELQATKKVVEEVKASYASATSELSTAKTELEATKAEVGVLKTSVATMEPLSKIGADTIKYKRDEALRLYRMSVQAPDDAVVGLFDKATPEELDGLIIQYTQGVTQKFAGKCKDCGSTHFSFRSTLVADDKDAPDPENTPTVSIEAMREKYSQHSFITKKQ